MPPHVRLAVPSSTGEPGLCELPADSTMPTEHPRRRKLAKTMPHHVLSDENIHERLAIMNGKRVPDELRHDHGATRPCLDRSLASRAVQSIDFPHQMAVYKRTFFYRSAHYFLLRATMNFVDAFFLLRVLNPLDNWPHGDIGWPPPLLLPSPPPIGWSTGFITTPRTCGRCPR